MALQALLIRLTESEKPLQAATANPAEAPGPWEALTDLQRLQKSDAEQWNQCQTGKEELEFEWPSLYFHSDLAFKSNLGSNFHVVSSAASLRFC